MIVSAITLVTRLFNCAGRRGLPVTMGFARRNSGDARGVGA
jgi:hypothetical protein